MDLSKYPKELTNKRREIECAFIMCLYKDTDLIDDYKNIVNGEDICTEDGVFYYGLAQNLYKLGYHTFDNVTIYTYLKDKDSLRDGFERRGGYRTIQEMMSVFSVENIETYYDELSKNNMLLRLHDKKFPVVDMLDKFSEMNMEQVYDYFDFQLNDLFVGKTEKQKTYSLSTGYQESFNNWDKGAQIGYKVGSAMLNGKLLGTHKSNLLLHEGYIGQGKSTTAILLYILPVIESGENVLIIGNEQSIDEWRNMIISAVVFNKIDEHPNMNRSTITKGHYTPEQREALNKAEAWLEDDEHGNLEFAELSDYSIIRVKKLIKKYSKLGYGLFIYDTLKPEKENSDKAWAEFSESAKELFQIAKKEDVAIIATAQLSSDSTGRKYLDLSCTGKSRAIAETASQVTMFRFLFADEYEKLKPYKFKKTSDGKWSNVKEIIDLDPNKKYIVVFAPKNRFGDTTTQIVMEFSQEFMTLHDVGYVNISPNARF